MIAKECEHCKKEFSTNRKNKRFCSTSCKNKYHYHNPKTVEPSVAKETNGLETVKTNVSINVEKKPKSVGFELAPAIKTAIVEKQMETKPQNNNSILNRLDAFLGDDAPKATNTPVEPKKVESSPIQDTVDFQKVLNQEKPPEKNESDFEVADTSNNSDFDPPSPTERIPIDIKETVEGVQLEESENPEKVKAKIPPGKMADTFITGFDVFNMFTAPKLYEKTFFSDITPEEKHIMKQLRGKIARNERRGGMKIELSEEELDLLGDYNDFEDYKEKIPFTPEEKQMLRTPLTILLKDKGADISPGWALIFAAFMVSLPRYSPMAMKGVSNRFFNKHSNTQQNNGKATKSKDSQETKHSTEEADDNELGAAQ